MFYLKFILILVIFFNASCSQKIQKTGLSSVKINEIKIEEGITTKSNLIKKYGPPVFDSVFNKNTVYYVSHVTGYKNLSDRKTLNLVVFEITFNDKNIVNKIKKYNKFDSKNVKISKKNSLEKNNTSIQFWKDIINNLRRRNVED
ncbi:MAG: outer membrane protein assembly factor BamE [Alphaproteobacteria bacterium]|nr:outer membrane protein assembly factor BamE [Alphaproteobacteria bacterium]